MPSGGRLTGLVALVVVLVSFAGACAGATDQRASGGASARTGAATGEPGASSVTATSPGPSGGGPSASASNVTECGAPDYPCDWADVPDATIDVTQRLTDEARARVVAGGSFADVAAWLQSQPGVATVESDDHAVRFRPVGGRAVWVVDEATFRGPAAARDSDFRLASVRIPVAGPPTDPDALVGGDIEDKQALVLSPYFWNFDPNDSAPSATAALQATRGYAGHVTQILNAKKGDQTVGLDAFEHWDQYDVVFVSSHGARICGAERCRAVIAAGELGAGQPISWFQRRSLRGTGVELMTDGSGTFTMLLDADFFRNWYPNGLDETLVIIDACETLGPKVSDIADVLRGSTSEYLGWTETVNAAISTTATSTLLKSMATGLTVRQAYRRLGSLKDDPGSGAQLSIVGPSAGDLRTREIVSFRDASGATTLAPGAKIPITGTPGDGQPDRVPWHVLVEGLDAEEAGATPLHVTIAGSTANPVTVADGKQVKPDVWLVDGEVPLTTDLAVGAPVSMRASVDLVDTGHEHGRTGRRRRRGEARDRLQVTAPASGCPRGRRRRHRQGDRPRGGERPGRRVRLGGCRLGAAGPGQEAAIPAGLRAARRHPVRSIGSGRPDGLLPERGEGRCRRHGVHESMGVHPWDSRDLDRPGRVGHHPDPRPDRELTPSRAGERSGRTYHADGHGAIGARCRQAKEATMGEKGMESTSPVGPGSAATAVAGGGIGQTKAGGALGSLNDAIGTTSGDPAQMAGEQLGAAVEAV